MQKIFILGGHKNGTLSLHNFFHKSGLKSFHGGSMCYKINGAWDFLHNMIWKHPQFNCYGDHFAEFFNTKNGPKIEDIKKLIDIPGSKFILNFRNKEDYIHSLFNHISWGSQYKNRWSFETDNFTIKQRVTNTHYCNQAIIKLFRELNIMDRLLVINICNGNNEVNSKLINNFLGLKNNISLENTLHEHKINKDKIAEKHNELKKKYKHILDDTLQNINITNEEYISNLEEIYQAHIKSLSL